MVASFAFTGLGIRVDVLIPSPQVILDRHTVISESLEIELPVNGAQQELVGLVLRLARKMRQIILDLWILGDRHLTV